MNYTYPFAMFLMNDMRLLKNFLVLVHIWFSGDVNVKCM